MMPVKQNLKDYNTVEEALADLCGGLCVHGAACLQCESVEPSALPEPFHGLLVHHRHMTTTLVAHYGKPVELRVLDHQLNGDLYRRRIVLTLAGTDQVVEFGVVRIDLSFASEGIRNQILERVVPLGDILSDHDVFRCIEPRWYIRVSGHCPWLIGGGPLWRHDTYGRVGTIYCGLEPAIELLEIITPAPCADEVCGS